jgi:hypothetical protein
VRSRRISWQMIRGAVTMAASY